jgi:uncharacterized membrane protein SpoIIM required for sporulation
MNASEFVKGREADWQRLEALINRRQALGPAEVRELGRLYRAVISDLALARRDFPGQRVTLFLNQLLTRAHGTIYRRDTSDLGQLAHYFTRQIPQTFRQTARFTLAATLLLFLPAVIGYYAAFARPQSADMFGLAEQRAILSEQQTWTDVPVEERPYASTFIMSNNIRVAILAFGGGITFGAFTVYVLVTNGLILGAVMGLAAHYGMGEALWTFVIGHGVIELSIIIISGGAGLQLAWVLLNPGPYTRRDALTLAARRAVALAILAVPALVCAGLIEGFISPAPGPLLLHAAVGLGSGALLFAYLCFAGHSRAEQVENH